MNDAQPENTDHTPTPEQKAAAQKIVDDFAKGLAESGMKFDGVTDEDGIPTIHIKIEGTAK